MSAIKLGTKSLKNVFIGNRQVSRIYKGAIKLFDCIRKVLSFSQFVTVPNDVGNSAKITMLGGMSRKCKNILNVVKPSATFGNLTVTSNGDGTYTLNGTNDTGVTQGFYIINNNNQPHLGIDGIAGKKIKLIGRPSTVTNDRARTVVTDSSYAMIGNDNLQDGFIMTDESVKLYIEIIKGASFNNDVFKVMLTEDLTVTYDDFEPYTDQLIDASVSNFVIAGSNLFNIDSIAPLTLPNNVIRIGVEIKEKVGTVLHVKATSTAGMNMNINVLVFTESTYVTSVIATETNAYSRRFTIESGKRYFLVSSNQYLETSMKVFKNTQIIMSRSDVSYTPYRESVIKTLPPAITEKLIGINADCYNYVDFERKVLVERVGVVDLGALVWRNFSTVGKSTLNLQGLIKKVGIDSSGRYEVANAISNKYAVVSRSDTTTLNALAVQNDGTIIVRFGESQTVPSGTLYYELETPIETDISDLLESNFNLLQVESGGTISFNYNNVENYIVDIPSEIEFKNK